MKAEAKYVSEPRSLTPCGRCSCVIMYKGDLCIFCDAASEILEGALSNYGVSSAVIKEVDIESGDDCGCDTNDVSMLPTIKICDAKFSGLPDEQMINDAVIRAIMKDCFCE
ncbi:hypothetical protein EU527_19455 [Candidatus Thorarchaeota archaeon]|nr:MAG: hypothetical protein EU527_19455 [Candidatus Thorarchaeota archaeon]